MIVRLKPAERPVSLEVEREAFGSNAEAAIVEEPTGILLGEPDFHPSFGLQPASAFGLRDPFTGRTASSSTRRPHTPVAHERAARQLNEKVRW